MNTNGRATLHMERELCLNPNIIARDLGLKEKSDIMKTSKLSFLPNEQKTQDTI